MRRRKALKRGIAKRVLALAMSLTMAAGVIPGQMTGTVQTKAAELPALQAVSLEAAREGIVLLKNEDNVLPLEGKKVSVFGRTQIDTFWKGYGSGGYIKSSYVSNVIDSLRKSTKVTLNEDLAGIYSEWVKTNPPNQNDKWQSAKHYNDEMPLTDDQVQKAKNNSDVAVVVIGRRWGEGRDVRLEEGSYYLTGLEKDMLSKVNKYFDDIVVVLNTASVMDMEWLDKNTYKNIDAYMYSWLGGVQSGASIADVLTGEVTPSGKLPMTIMDKLENEETWENFGGIDDKGNKKQGFYYNTYNNYEEDIYLGYRYSETFGDEHVMHPFGFGMSYTDFSVTTDSITVDDKNGVKDDVINVNVTVKNTGSKYTGKEVVQVYYGAPQGVLGKPAKSLVAYAKTHELRPGETQKIKLSFKVDMMASYDETGKTKSDYKSSYVLEVGNYPIYVGNSVKAEQPDCYDGYKVQELTLVEKLQTVQPPVENFDRVVAKTENGKVVAKKEQAPKTTRDVDKRITDNLPKEIKQTGDKGIKLIDVYNGKKTIQEFVAQLTNDEVARLCRGVGGMGDGAGIAGNASAWGADWSKYGVPAASTCDGPSGIRWSGMATAIPTAISLGSTWNDELIEKLCVELGNECIATTGNNNKGVDILLAPGMNIIRDPRGGRNYEYFSEDPLLTGRLASAYVSGLQKVGVIANVKHYAGYQQGEARDCTVDSRMSERCLREIYLKPFEISIKESNPYTLMDSNGDINGEEVYGSYDLNTTVLRKEWNWDGMVMTDWGPPESTYNGSRGELKNMAHWVQSGCDCTMPGHKQGNYLIDSINKKNGGISLAEAQRNAINVLNCLMKTMKFARDNKIEFYKYTEPEYEAFTVETQEQYKPTLNAIYVDGEKIDGFATKIYDYTVFVRDLTKMPKITYDTPENTTVQARTEGTTTYLSVTSQGAVSVYKIVFTNQAGLTPTVKNPTYAYLNNIALNGKNIPNFYPSDLIYSVVNDTNFDNITLTCDTPEGVTAKVTKDKEKKAFFIRSESEHQAMEYVVYIISTPPQSDDFKSSEIGSFWKVSNKNNNLSKEADHLAITTEKGYLHVNEEDNVDAKNIVYQPAGGDWENETQVKFDQLPNDKHHAVGIWLSDNLNRDNFIWFRIEYTSQGIDIRVNKRGNGVETEVVRDNNFAKNNNLSNKKQIYFKVTKTGNEYTFAVRKDSQSAYTSMGSTTADFANPTFALAAINNASTKPITAQFHQTNFTTGGSGVEQNTTPFVVKSANTNHCNRMYLADKAYYLHNLKIENSSGEEAGNKNLTGVQSGSYALYNVNVEESGYYRISARQASEVASTSWDQLGFGIQVDGFPGTTWEELGGTDGGQKWRTLAGSSVYLSKGSHRIKLYFITDSMNLCWLEFDVDKLGEKEPDNTDPAEELATAKAALQSAVDTAETYNKEGYTTESWTEFEAALKAAKAALENKEAKADDIRNATKALTTAQNGLKKTDTTVNPLPDTDPDDTYEAEKAALTSACVVSDGAFDGKFVGELGGSKGGKATFTVKADKAGKYDLDIYYITHYDRDFEVTVNNGEAVAVKCAGNNTDWDATVQKTAITVELNAGVNTIALGNTKDYAPNLDKIVVTLKEAKEDIVPENDPVKAAKAVLQVTVDAAATYEEADYTEETWKEFKEAYDAAVKMLEKEDATEEEVNAAKDKLVAAQNALEKVTQPEDEALKKAKTDLAEAVAAAKEAFDAGQSRYTAESWPAFAKAYADATNPTAVATATAEELNALTAALTKAQSGLVEKPIEEQNAALEAAKASLATAIAKAKDVYDKEELNYTADSWNEFKKAYEAAVASAETGDANVETLNRLEKALTDAQGKLVPEEPDHTCVESPEEKAGKELAQALDEARATYDAGQLDYTNETWTAFKNAYLGAISNRGNADVKTLNDLKNKLVAAKEGLKKVQPNTGIPNTGKPDSNPSTSNPGAQNPPAALPNLELTPEESAIANLLGVTTEAAKEIHAIAKQYNVSNDTLALTEAKVTATKSESDVSGSSFAKIQAKAAKQAKSSVKLSWNKVAGADGYLVYGNKCGKNSAYDLIATIQGGDETTYTQKKLKKASSYKYIVCAYKNVGNTKVTIAASKTIHTVTKGCKNVFTKSIKVSKSKVRLEAGDSEKLTVREIKTGKLKTHRKLSYESSDTAVATVSKSGKIKAKGKGTCTVYVYAQNGVFKKVKVTVK